MACSYRSLARSAYSILILNIELNAVYRYAHSYTTLKLFGYFLRAFSASAGPSGSIVSVIFLRRLQRTSTRLSFTLYPTSTSSEVSKKSASSVKTTMSGVERPASHLWTAPTVILKTSASCS